jgi:glutamyl-tRNA reductase
VAAGLHAAVLGETQILGQVRQGLANADAELRRLCEPAVAAARDLRREEGLAADTSRSFEAALAQECIAPRGRLLVLGAGHMGKAIARRARSLGFADVVVAVRNAAGRELDIAGATIVDLATVGEIERVQVAVGCLGDRNGAAVIERLPQADLYVDLGTPANFPGVTHGRVTIATLIATEPEVIRERRRVLAARLHSLLARRLEYATRTAATPHGRLRQEIEAIRLREIEAIERMLPAVHREAVDAITRRLVNQIFHLPTTRLMQHPDTAFGDRVADLFAAEKHAP